MSRALWRIAWVAIALLAATIAACGAPPPPTTPGSKGKPSVWSVARIPALGASAAFPEAPSYNHTTEGDRAPVEVYSLTTPPKGDAPAHGLICTVVGHESLIN